MHELGGRLLGIVSCCAWLNAAHHCCTHACHPTTRPSAGDALEMAGKLAAGGPAALAVDGQSFEMLPGFVEIKKERKKMNGR